MAIEWYLLKPPHDQLSGFESDALNDFGRESFEELLESDFAVDVELYNYDLSVCKPLRAIIQHNVDDTKLKTLTRELYVPIGTCKAGMYIKYKDRFWLIVGLVDDNKIYEKGIMSICNYLISWRTSDDRIIQRWANVTSASQYNNGETGTRNYEVRSDQLLILTPDDKDCLLLDNGQRFIIDRRCDVYEKEFDENTTCVTNKPLITYELTRSDSVLYSYRDSGHYEFMVTQDEQHAEDGYYVIDGKGYWLCEMPKKVDKADGGDEPETKPYAEIEYDDLYIYNGLDAVAFVARFFDVDGQETTATPQWNINCDFADKLDVEYADNSILISANSKKLINKSFELSLSADGYDTVSVTVTIRAFI